VEHHAVIKARTGQGLDALDMSRGPVRLQPCLDTLAVRQVENPHVLGIDRGIVIDRRKGAQGSRRCILFGLFGIIAEGHRRGIVLRLLRVGRAGGSEKSDGGKGSSKRGFDHGSIRIVTRV